MRTESPESGPLLSLNLPEEGFHKRQSGSYLTRYSGQATGRIALAQPDSKQVEMAIELLGTSSEKARKKFGARRGSVYRRKRRPTTRHHGELSGIASAFSTETVGEPMLAAAFAGALPWSGPKSILLVEDELFVRRATGRGA
jgi:hypothetical protein